MNLLAIARHGIGICGTPPVAIAIARGIAIDCIRHADRSVLAIQAAGAEAERGWLARPAGRFRPSSLPPGLVLAVRIDNGTSPVGSLIVAERESELGVRDGSVLRVGVEAVELDRRDGTAALRVLPRIVGLADAEAWARSWARDWSSG